MKLRRLLIWILLLGAGVGDVAAQSPPSTTCERELAEVEADADDLAKKLARCQAERGGSQVALEIIRAQLAASHSEVRALERARGRLEERIDAQVSPLIVAGVGAGVGAVLAWLIISAFAP